MKYRNKTAVRSVWTEKRVARLKELWGRGLSAVQIAKQLGAGISRNAVLGKILRLKLCRRASRPVRIKHKPRRRHSFKSEPAFVSRHLPSQAAIEVEPFHIAFADLEPSHCRWPFGDGPYTFCGHPTVSDRSYCVHHRAIARRGPGHTGGFQYPSSRKPSIQEAA